MTDINLSSQPCSGGSETPSFSKQAMILAARIRHLFSRQIANNVGAGMPSNGERLLYGRKRTRSQDLAFEHFIPRVRAPRP